MTQYLSEFYRVQSRFQRATRIDADTKVAATLNGFVLHETGRQLIERLFEQVQSSEQRAFTWTGPYGTGKSSLALYLAALLGADPALRKKARTKIGNAGVANLQSLCPEVVGPWLVVCVVGQRTKPEQLVAQACDEAAREFWGVNLPAELYVEYDHDDTSQVVNRLLSCSAAAAERGGGLLLIVDEMGKFLESATEADSDMHFFQEIAEQFSRSEGLSIFLGILHQSFQEYAGRADRKRRNEWAKIQGRFVDAPFSVSVEESIELVTRAISGPAPSKQRATWVKNVTRQVTRGRLAAYTKLPSRLCECLPLHPFTAMLLPAIARQRFGQNERSVFSFLSSGEPGGFKDFLASTPATKRTLFTLDLLWDYLELNLEQTILASPIGHRWAEATEAIARVEPENDLSRRLTKIIAMVDLFGRSISLFATRQFLLASIPNAKAAAVDTAMKDLKASSVAVFRRHLDGWAISAGSDIDIDEAVEVARGELREDLEAILSKIPPQPPVIAKRHYHARGTFRWYGVHVVSVRQLSTKTIDRLTGAADGAFVMVIGEAADAVHPGEASKQLYRELERPFLVAIGSTNPRLLESVSELAAAEHVYDRVPEIQTDAVARRELEARINLLRSRLEAEVQTSLTASTWYANGKALRGASDLSRLASEISDKIYVAAPTLRNELINRHKPSSNAIAARRALLHRMVAAPDQRNLGIEKFPPELGLYLSLLQSTGLHIQTSARKKTWRFVRPSAEGEAKQFAQLWSCASDVLDKACEEGRLASVSEIYAAWRRPPFGLRDGVMPLLALAYVLSRDEELALYFDGVFEPAIDDFFVDRMQQSPEKVTLRVVTMSGVGQEVFMRLAVLSADISKREVRTALDAAKALVQFAHRLHPWVQRTTHLSPNTRAVRNVLLRANDPHALLFSDLPTACGYRQGIKNRKHLEGFVAKLQVAHAELRTAYDRLTDQFRCEAVKAFGLPNICEESLRALQERASCISGRSGDMALDALLLRLHEALSNEHWVEGLMSLLAGKPTRAWTDNDITQAQVTLVDFANRFDRVASFLHAHGELNQGTALTLYIADAGQQPREYSRAFELTPSEAAKARKAAKALKAALAQSGLGRNAQFAALAEAFEAVTSAVQREQEGQLMPSFSDREVA